MTANRQGKKSRGRPPSSAAAHGRSWLADKAPVLVFGLKFAALMVLFYAVSMTQIFDRALYAYLAANAWLSNAILNGLGQASRVSDITIRSARFAITVRRGCDAVEPACFFGAAVLSFPAPLARKIPGLLAGMALILTMNLLRIVSLYLIGAYAPRFFNPAHLEIWPAAFIIAAILLWIAWIKWTRRAQPSPPHGVT